MNSVQKLVLTAATAVALTASALLPAARGAEAASAPATTQGAADATLQIYSARVSRVTLNENREMQRRFAGRFQVDGSPGVALQLLLTLSGDTTLLPITRTDALRIDTFVDDTYDSLLAGSNDFRTGAQGPVVSADGKQVMFAITSGRAPADEAERLFVRGNLQARVTRGPSKTASAKLDLKAGTQVDVGPFRTTLRSIADNGSTLALTMAVAGDVGRIRQVRLLAKDGRRLNSDDVQTRFLGGTPNVLNVDGNTNVLQAAIPPAQDVVTVEFTYAERVEAVRIPFEAQVDFGLTRAGPLPVVAPKADAAGGAGRAAAAPATRPGGVRDATPRERTWPPPPPQAVAGEAFRSRRTMFDPATAPSTTAPSTTAPARDVKVAKAAADLFALTVAKPAPHEVKDANWSTPPAPAFAASGYTLAQLLLSTPDVSILSVAPDGIVVTRFEDDKGKHDTTVYRDASRDSYNRGPRAMFSPDGQQALLHVTLAAAPHPGATRCTIAGSVRAKVAANERIDTSAPLSIHKGQEVPVGPLALRVIDVRQQPLTSPAHAANRETFEITLKAEGPIGNLRTVGLVNSKTGVSVASRAFGNPPYYNEGSIPDNSTILTLIATELPSEPVVVRVRHFEKAEVITVPFELTTGIGL